MQQNGEKGHRKVRSNHQCMNEQSCACFSRVLGTPLVWCSGCGAHLQQRQLARQSGALEGGGVPAEGQCQRCEPSQRLQPVHPRRLRLHSHCRVQGLGSGPPTPSASCYESSASW